MNTRISTTTLAVVLLGLVAVGAAGFGLVVAILGSVASDFLVGPLGATAQVALVAIGVLSLVLAGGAATSARELVAGRVRGIVIGSVIGAALVIGPAVAAASGGWHPALTASLLLGAALLATMVGALRSGTPRQA